MLNDPRGDGRDASWQPSAFPGHLTSKSHREEGKTCHE
jgi:hypothetical protein